ncbi:MAG TPA: hypothetical protein VNO30_12950 [Kofleriaceae bacterium]|nr:hypothetical protein [Kofleriaceae bacterium]
MGLLLDRWGRLLPGALTRLVRAVTQRLLLWRQRAVKVLERGRELVDTVGPIAARRVELRELSLHVRDAPAVLGTPEAQRDVGRVARQHVDEPGEDLVVVEPGPRQDVRQRAESALARTPEGEDLIARVQIAERAGERIVDHDVVEGLVADTELEDRRQRLPRSEDRQQIDRASHGQIIVFGFVRWRPNDLDERWDEPRRRLEEARPDVDGNPDELRVASPALARIRGHGARQQLPDEVARGLEGVIAFGAVFDHGRGMVSTLGATASVRDIDPPC